MSDDTGGIVDPYQKAYDESLPYEGSSSGLRKHLIEAHGTVDPPAAGYTQGEWTVLADLHAAAHLGRCDRRPIMDDRGGIVRCEPCGFVHDGPLCECGERLYLKGSPPRWQHVHTYSTSDDHDPKPARLGRT